MLTCKMSTSTRCGKIQSPRIGPLPGRPRSDFNWVNHFHLLIRDQLHSECLPIAPYILHTFIKLTSKTYNFNKNRHFRWLKPHEKMSACGGDIRVWREWAMGLFLETLQKVKLTRGRQTCLPFNMKIATIASNNISQHGHNCNAPFSC
jgi:hypothetical protein